MAHAAHGDRPGRATVTVAQLLGRPGPVTAVPEPAPHAETPVWAVTPLTGRQRVSRAAGSVLAIGSIVATAALCGQPEHGPMSTQAGDGGLPSLLPLRPAPDPEPAPVDRPSRPVSERAPQHRAARPKPVTRPRPRPAPAQPEAEPARRPSRHETTDEPAAGSALSSLTPPIDPDLVLDVL